MATTPTPQIAALNGRALPWLPRYCTAKPISMANQAGNITEQMNKPSALDYPGLAKSRDLGLGIAELAEYFFRMAANLRKV